MPGDVLASISRRLIGDDAFRAEGEKKKKKKANVKSKSCGELQGMSAGNKRETERERERG